jgi:hypothetical protein
MKIYTWDDLCDFEFLLGEKYRISHMIRAIDMQGSDESSVISKRLYCKYLGAIDESVKELGYEVKDDEARKLGFAGVK